MMRHLIILLLLISLVKCEKEDVTLSCIGEYRNFEYTCVFYNQIVTVNSSIVGINTTHLEGKTDNDVEKIEFENSRLYTLRPHFREKFDNLRIANASRCGIEAMFRMSNCDNLEELNLERNHLVSLWNSALSNCYNLKRINLRINQIYDITQGPFQNLTRLESLNLEWNLIRKLYNPMFKDLKNLKFLNLSMNDINTIYWNDEVFGPLENLEILDLSDNQINGILDASTVPRKLRIFKVSEMKIRQFPKGLLEQMESLEELYLINNQNFNANDTFFNEIKNLKNLRILNLNGNLIFTLLHSVFDSFEHLEQLSLANGQIYRISEKVFQNLENLKTLDLEINRIQFLNGRYFQNAKSLESLNLQRNSLTIFQSVTFSGLRNLRNFDLAFNMIEKLNEADFSDLKKLTHLQLRNNQINQIQRKSFEKMENLRFLDLTDNLCADKFYILEEENKDSIWRELEPCFRNSGPFIKNSLGMISAIIFISRYLIN